MRSIGCVSDLYRMIFGREVAFNAVQTTVDRRVGVAPAGDHTALRATNTHRNPFAKTARRFIPFDGFLLPTTARATPSSFRPAAAAATRSVTALAFIKLRRLSFIVFLTAARITAGDKPATPPTRPQHCVLTQLFASAFHS